MDKDVSTKENYYVFECVNFKCKYNPNAEKTISRKYKEYKCKICGSELHWNIKESILNNLNIINKTI